MRFLIPLLAFSLMPTFILAASNPSLACSRPGPKSGTGGDGPNCKPPNPRPSEFSSMSGVTGLMSVIAINPQPLPPEGKKR